MRFELESAMAVLGRTPDVLEALLSEQPDEWVSSTGDRDDWQPFDVVGHLIHGERTDWIPRARIILDEHGGRPFEAFDRWAQFEASAGKELAELLAEFRELRRQNLETLRDWRLSTDDLEKIGEHPELGSVTLRELVATWVVHDLNHLGQITRSMAGRYAGEVGPWRAYLSILSTRPE